MDYWINLYIRNFDICLHLFPPVDPDDVNALIRKNISWISFKFYMRVDTPLRYIVIEIWYPVMTLYPPNLQNEISP